MIILHILALIFIISPFLPATGHPHWFFRTADFVRLQSIVVALILLAFLVYFGNFNNWVDWTFLSGLVIAVVYQFEKVYQYSSWYPKKKHNYKSDGHISLFSANVLQTNTNYDAFLSEARRYDPDIIVTMESDLKWENGLKELEKTHPFTLKAPNDKFYGMHLYAKKAFKNAEIKYQVEDHVPSLFIEFPISDAQDIQFLFLHPAPPSPTENETSKERDAELMLTAQEIRRNPKSAVVCGDMNDVVWSRISRLFTKITDMVDPRIGRGFFSTYYAQYWFMRFPLDHLFHTKDLFVKKMARSRNFGSDHFAMYYEIHLKQQEVTDKKYVLDEEDKEFVAEILDRVDE